MAAPPRWIALAVALGVAGAIESSAREQPGRQKPPSLLVLIVVDQMRADYLERARPVVQHGFRRLLGEGAVFEQAAYPYATTVTCAGHATIASGSYPMTHGIIGNEWWSRAENRRILCTDDAAAASVPYVGGVEKNLHGARRLRAPTLGDRLRARDRSAEVVTLSMKPRSAVMLAGRRGTSVTWFVDGTHGWATSTAFTAAPRPDLAQFFAANPIERDRAATWTPIDAGAFTGRDDGPGERPKRGWSAAFPHPLSGAPGTPDWQFYELWKCSPYADDYLASMAIAQVKALGLGQRGAIDLLGVGFSSLDCVGHDFGPDSAEVHDTVRRLDRTLGALFGALDTLVGRDRYLVALSADHGVSPIPEAMRAEGRDAGRVLAADIRKTAEAAMEAAHGPGPHIASVIAPYVSLSPATRALVERRPESARPILDAVARMPGILRVFPTRGLERWRTSADPMQRAAALSYHREESGEIMFVVKPYWLSGDTSAASHGTPHDYDRRVPVVLMGARIRAGRYAGPASPGDIAPTLATVVNLTLGRTDGRALTEALLRDN